MYAVVKIKWHQYLVKKGDQITVDLVDADEGKKVTFEDVLLWFKEDGTDVVIGENPFTTLIELAGPHAHCFLLLTLTQN